MRLPLYAGVGALILFVPIMIYGIDLAEMAYIFIAGPIISLSLIAVAIFKKERLLAVLSMLAAYWIISMDIDAGPRIGVPSARTGTEAGRRTKAVKLRLRPEDALRLRASAREAGVDLSEYVARLLDDPQRVAAARVPVSSLPLADVSRLAGVLGALPEEVRRARRVGPGVRAGEALV